MDDKQQDTLGFAVHWFIHDAVAQIYTWGIEGDNMIVAFPPIIISAPGIIWLHKQLAHKGQVLRLYGRNSQVELYMIAEKEHNTDRNYEWFNYTLSQISETVGGDWSTMDKQQAKSDRN